MPGALDLLRSLRDTPDETEVAVLAATDPANPYGATVILVNGALAAYLPRGDRQLVTVLPDVEPDRSRVGRAIARALIDRARAGGESPRGRLIEDIDGAAPDGHPLAPLLKDAGFVSGAMGLQATFRRTGGSSGSGGTNG